MEQHDELCACRDVNLVLYCEMRMTADAGIMETGRAEKTTEGGTEGRKGGTGEGRDRDWNKEGWRKT